MPSFQVTLTDADTNYKLLTLVREIDANFVDSPAELSIQSDETNADDILVGGSALAADRFGYRLNQGEGRTYQRKSLGNTLARSATAAQKLNIEVKR